MWGRAVWDGESTGGGTWDGDGLDGYRGDVGTCSVEVMSTTETGQPGARGWAVHRGISRGKEEEDVEVVGSVVVVLGEAAMCEQGGGSAGRSRRLECVSRVTLACTASSQSGAAVRVSRRTLNPAIFSVSLAGLSGRGSRSTTNKKSQTKTM